MAAQFMEAAHRELPDLHPALSRGDYSLLRNWLTENIYRHGRAYSATELLQRVTGAGLQTNSYLKYLEAKFTQSS
jgi:carboxypeptidase Taq